MVSDGTKLMKDDECCEPSEEEKMKHTLVNTEINEQTGYTDYLASIIPTSAPVDTKQKKRARI